MEEERRATKRAYERTQRDDYEAKRPAMNDRYDRGGYDDRSRGAASRPTDHRASDTRSGGR